jgi:hypothetical protein
MKSTLHFLDFFLDSKGDVGVGAGYIQGITTWVTAPTEV